MSSVSLLLLLWNNDCCLKFLSDNRAESVSSVGFRENDGGTDGVESSCFFFFKPNLVNQFYLFLLNVGLSFQIVFLFILHFCLNHLFCFLEHPSFFCIYLIVLLNHHNHSSSHCFSRY